MHLIRRLARSPKGVALSIFVDLQACGILYALIEHKNYIKGIWWAIVTASTVGYGDFYPATTAGRFIGAVLIISMWWLSILAGAQVTANLIQDPDAFTDQEQKAMQAEIYRLTDLCEAIYNRQTNSMEEVD